MLDAIKKKLGFTSPTVEAAVETIEELALVVDETTIATELSVMGSPLDTALTALTGDLATAVASLAAMTINFEVAQAALNALTAEKAELAVKAQAAKFTARKEKVVMAIGTSEKSEALMLATQGLDDVAFAAVVDALAGSVDAEAKTGLFTEVGVAGSPDATKIVVESKEMTLIKKKYNKAK